MPPESSKVILITGTSSGFGLLTALRLACAGHIVYATMRDLNKAHDLIEVLKNHNTQAYIRSLDVTKPQTITIVIDEIIKNHGRIDVLINNAGFGLGGFFEDLTQEEIRSVMEVNFFGVQNVSRVVIPFMRKQKSGRIINISSIAGQTTSPAFSTYNCSKWAVEAFSECLSHELSLFGIDVVIVEPGSYPTKIFFENAQYAKNFDNPQSPYFPISQRLKNMIMKYISASTKDPNDIAKLIERIINTKKPKLRYVSDFSSWCHIMTRKIFPIHIYQYFFRKAIYGNTKHSV